MPEAKNVATLSRIERVRRMLEEDGDDRSIVSADAVSYAPWDRVKSTGGKAERGIVDRAFSTAQITVIEAYEQGNTVVVRWRLRGKWSGAIPSIPIKPTGKDIDITGTNTYRFVGDKIVEKTGEFDVAALHADACERVNPADCVEALNVLATRVNPAVIVR